MRHTTIIVRQTAQIMIIIITALWTAPRQSTIIRRPIIKLTRLGLLQLLLSTAWGVAIKAAQMFPIIMIARRIARIMITIIPAIWTVLKQVTTIAAKPLEATMGNTTTITTIKVGNRIQDDNNIFCIL
ncbi:MAG: hypothetical protein J1E37_08900 [Prevotella sp.]|nr:hypothetical protein [Prevotella sp.]